MQPLLVRVNPADIMAKLYCIQSNVTTLLSAPGAAATTMQGFFAPPLQSVHMQLLSLMISSIDKSVEMDPIEYDCPHSGGHPIVFPPIVTAE